MKTLYLDCTNGVSGDMVLHALAELAGIECAQLPALEIHSHSHDHGHTHDHDHAHTHDHDHGHGRSYEDVKHIIDSQEHYTAKARETAQNIYAVIARAESSVHGETLETIHFHEVGRDQAIANALGRTRWESALHWM